MENVTDITCDEEAPGYGRLHILDDADFNVFVSCKCRDRSTPVQASMTSEIVKSLNDADQCIDHVRSI